MKKRSIALFFFSSAALAWLALGPAAAASDSEVFALLARAEEQIMRTDSREAALELIDTYESVLEIDPDNYEALWSLARYHVLVGVAYTEDGEEKEKLYAKAVEYSVQGMRTNPEFRRLTDKGVKLWNAASVLDKDQIEALFYWYNANGLISKECQSKAQMILYSYRLPRFKKVMTRMLEIDPEWAGGHPYFAWASYYAAIPEIMGRDLDRAEEYFNKAQAAGPSWLYIKYSKAVLLHTARGDRDAFIRDLEWVLAQDPKEAPTAPIPSTSTSSGKRNRCWRTLTSTLNSKIH